MVIRVSRAYRIVLGNAELVISGLTPIDLLAKERKNVHEGTGGGKEKEREKWRHGNRNGVGNRKYGSSMWTRRMILDIRLWITRKHGEVCYHTTKVLRVMAVSEVICMPLRRPSLSSVSTAYSNLIP